MLKGKLKLSAKAPRVFPDRIGSLVSGFDDKEDENGESDSALDFESGEELEILQPSGAGSGREIEDGYVDIMEGQLESRVRQRSEKDGSGLVSVKEVIAADEKRSDLEYEVRDSQVHAFRSQ